MYPRNAASPEPISIGAVIQISDGAVQTSGVTVRIKPIGVSEGDGAGTTAYSTDGIVIYTPTQAETNYTSFILIAKKTGCIPVSVTVVTSASATPGYAGTDQSKIANPTTTVALTGTTIANTQKVDVETIKTNPVVNGGTVTFPTNATLASTTNITAATGIVLAGVTHTGAVIPTVTTLTGHTAQTGDTFALANGANGFVAIKADTAAILTDTADMQPKFGTINDLGSGATIAANLFDTYFLFPAYSANYWEPTNTNVSTLLSRLTATRAGYLDNLSGGAVALEATAQAIVTDTNELQTDWANGGRLDVILDARASQASVDTVDGIVDAILLDTAEIGAAGAGLTAIPWNVSWDAEVQSEVNDALTAFWTSPATLVDLIWDEASAGHLTAGSMGAKLNSASLAGDPLSTSVPGAYAAGTAGYIIGTFLTANTANPTVTISTSSLSIDSVVAGGKITVHRGDYISFQLTSLGTLTGRTGEKLYFTVKSTKDTDLTDAAAIIQATETTGAVRVNGSAIADLSLSASDASITVDDASAGDITIVLKSALTKLLAPANRLFYDIQMINASGEAETLTSGDLKVNADVTRRQA